MTIKQAREAIARLAPGTAVGHANRELAGWEGVIEPDGRGQWWRYDGDVRVRWTAGTDGNGGPLAGGKPGWIGAAAVTIKGQCPDCARPAHYISAGNPYDRAEGWHHDQRADADTCWAGKAAFEAGRAGQRAAPAYPHSAEIIAALPLRQRPGLYIDPAPEASGNLTVLERDEDPDDGPAKSIIGLAVRDGKRLVPRLHRMPRRDHRSRQRHVPGPAARTSRSRIRCTSATSRMSRLTSTSKARVMKCQVTSE